MLRWVKNILDAVRKPNAEIQSYPPEFFEWAFGDASYRPRGAANPALFQPSTAPYNTTLMNLWNRRHGHLYRIEGSNLIHDSLHKMWDIYVREHK